MGEENISQEFRLIKIDETRNYFVEEIQQNELMSKKTKKVVRRQIIVTSFSYFSFNSY